MTTIDYRFLFFLWTSVLISISISGSAQPTGPDHQTPPAPYAIPVEQPDGSLIRLYVRGDQAHHWAETLDGYTVIKNRTGYYEYATLKNGRLVGNEVRAQDPQDRSLAAQRSLLSLSRHQEPPSAFQPLTARTAAASPSSVARTLANASMPSAGKVRLLAICIDYPDQPATYRIEDFLRLFNGPNQGRSFSDYFKESSYGKLDISVNVVGWTRAKNSYQSYSHGKNGFDGARGLVAEAIDAAEARGVDFSKYDNNNDGNVDGIIVIHAGPGTEEAADNNYIWSHRWAINSRFYDGRNISDYMIQPEIRFSERVNIGIFCHEFGHLLGLPDLYDTDDRNGINSGIGHWGLMARGGWGGQEAVPSGLCAWSKSALNWADVQDITGKYGAYTLPAASQNNSFIKIRTPRPSEYFLLENRQRAGVDTELPGSGMAIWHIDSDKTAQYPERNQVNGDTNRKGVDLEEADGRDELDALPAHMGDAGDLFPGTAGNASFFSESYPSSDTYVAQQGSTNSSVNLQDIRQRNGIISFTYQKDGTDVGSACDDPAVAVVGNNEATRSVNWYEFTLPSDGVVSLQSAGSPQGVKVYGQCAENPLAQASGSEISLAYLPKGQRLLIRWEFASQPARPVAWKLSVEKSVVRADSLALVAVYQKMEGARWSKRNNWLQGKVASWEGVRTEKGRVTELHFEQAGLKNSFPKELYQLTGLKKFTVIQNQLSGEISAELASITQLEAVRIEVPKLSVRFLQDLGQLTNLRRLKLAGVVVGTALPKSIGKLQKLEKLELPNVQLTGEIPSELGQIASLNYLDLSQNQLTGSTPTALFESNLTYLDLHDNRIEGLANNLFTSSKLRTCYLHNNRLAGALPREVGRESTVPLTLNLSLNQLTGSVPESWTRIAFEELALNNNQLGGSLPALPMPKRLDISGNGFTKLATLPSVGSSASVLICHNNQLTFEDLLPNRRYLNCTSCQDRYAPQGDRVLTIERSLKAGDASTISLPFDEQVTTSQYVWYRQDKLVYQSEANALTIESFSTAQAGAYECLITNPAFPGLTLRAVGIVLNIQEKLTQELTLMPVGSKRFGDNPFRLNGQSSTGLPVTYQKVEGPITVKEDVVSIQGAGAVIIKMVVSGNDTYSPSERTIQFTIAKAKPTIQVGEVADKTYGDEPFTLDVKANEDLSVNLNVEAGKVSTSNRTITIEGAGAVRILATRPEDQDYEAAEAVLVSFNVRRAEQVVTFDSLGDFRYEPEGEIPLFVTTSSALSPEFNVTRGGIEIANGVAIIQQAGEVTIRVRQPGNDNYRPATPRQRSFTISKASQQIFFSEVTNKLTTDPAFTLDARSSASLPVAFQIVSGPATLSDDNLVTLQGQQAGEVVVEANQAGNVNYLPADSVIQRILVRSPAKESQVIVLTPLPDTVMVGESVALEVTTDKGLVPDIKLEGSAQASYTDGLLSFEAVGNLEIHISHPGNEEYNPVSTQKNIFVRDAPSVIEPQSQTLVFGPSDREYGKTIDVNTAQGERPTVEVVTGPATVTEGGTVVTTGTGPVFLKVTHPESSRFAAIDTVLEFLITRASQQITFEAVSLTDSSFHLQANAPSGLPVSFTIDSGQGILRGDTLVALASGAVVVTARQSGNDNYLASDPVSKTFEVEIITANEPSIDPVPTQIFPNPSQAIFYVRWAGSASLVHYRLVDVRGHQLMEGKFSDPEGSLDLAHLASGAYILYLQTNSATSHHRLLKE